MARSRLRAQYSTLSEHGIAHLLRDSAQQSDPCVPAVSARYGTVQKYDNEYMQGCGDGVAGREHGTLAHVDHSIPPQDIRSATSEGKHGGSAAHPIWSRRGNML